MIARLNAEATGIGEWSYGNAAQPKNIHFAVATDRHARTLRSARSRQTAQMSSKAVGVIRPFCPGLKTNARNQIRPMLRFLDVVLAAIGLVVAAPVMLIIMVLGYFDTAAPIFTQVRMGRHTQPFTLVKFRTMRHGTESVATHLVDPAVVTPFGSVLRRTKLDELPQLWNVLKGEMSMVGPRPCLFSQQELIQVRAARGVFQARPGITGLAQVQGIDMSEPELLADTDARMLESLGVAAYLGYIVKTLTGSGQGDRMRG